MFLYLIKSVEDGYPNYHGELDNAGAMTSVYVLGLSPLGYIQFFIKVLLEDHTLVPFQLVPLRERDSTI